MTTRSIARRSACGASRARSVRSASSTLHCCYLPSSKARGAAPARAIARVRKAVIEERLKRRREMLDEITPSRLDKLRKRLVQVAAPEPRAHVPRNALAEAAQQSAQRARKLKAAIDRAGGIYLADRLHRVRVEAKKLRYALEIQRELTHSRSTAGLSRLEDAAGPARPHARPRDPDRSRARRRRASCSPRDRRGMSELNRLIRALEDECREGHAAYMHGRPALLKLCDGVIAADHSKPTAA